MPPKKRTGGIAPPQNGIQVPLNIDARAMIAARRQDIEGPSVEFGIRDATAFGSAPQYADLVANSVDLDAASDVTDHLRKTFNMRGVEKSGSTPYFSKAAGAIYNMRNTRQLGSSPAIDAPETTTETIVKQLVDETPTVKTEEEQSLDETSNSLLLVVAVGAVVGVVLVAFS